MTPITVSVDQLIGWGVTGYTFMHVMFGLVTHYHSVLEVRRYNKSPASGVSNVGALAMLFLFFGRMTIGLPWFMVSRLVAPIGNRWHWSAEEIQRQFPGSGR